MKENRKPAAIEAVPEPYPLSAPEKKKAGVTARRSRFGPVVVPAIFQACCFLEQVEPSVLLPVGCGLRRVSQMPLGQRRLYDMQRSSLCL